MERFTRRLLSEMFNFIMAATILITMTAINANAELKSLSDLELSAVYAEGFSNFTIDDFDNDGLIETLAEFNIHAYTYTTIDSLKLGYYNNTGLSGIPVTTSTIGLGWDQNWTDVVIGRNIDDPDNDFKAEGVYFKAEFENIDNPTTRELKSISFGSNSATGDISAYWHSFNGTINETDNYYRTPISDNGVDASTGATVEFINSPFEIALTLDKGFWVNFGDATNPVNITYDRTYDMP